MAHSCLFAVYEPWPSLPYHLNVCKLSSHTSLERQKSTAGDALLALVSDLSSAGQSSVQETLSVRRVSTDQGSFWDSQDLKVQEGLRCGPLSCPALRWQWFRGRGQREEMRASRGSLGVTQLRMKTQVCSVYIPLTFSTTVGCGKQKRHRPPYVRVMDSGGREVGSAVHVGKVIRFGVRKPALVFLFCLLAGWPWGRVGKGGCGGTSQTPESSLFSKIKIIIIF